MVLLSSISACIPWLPTSAAAALTLRSPRSLLLDVQAEKLPDSNPSAKIRSDTLDVFVAVGVRVKVGDGPGVKVDVGVGVRVGVNVAPGVGVFVGVFVLVGVRLGVEVLEPPEPEILISH